MADSARHRGWKWDKINGYMEVWDSGTAVCRFDATGGMTVLIDGFDLNGQTITTVTTGTGSAAMDTWVAAFNGANGGADESPKYALVLSVGGTDYYLPAFTSIAA
jgi:hypothetical protein